MGSYTSLMLLSSLQYLGILLALGNSLVLAVKEGESETTKEELLDSNYELPDPPDQADNNEDQKDDARSIQKHTSLVHSNRPSDSNNLLNQLRDQILDAHTKNSQKEIDYDVVKQFGKSKDKEAKQKLIKNFHHVDAESDELQEIDYDTVRKFNPSQNEEVRSESDNTSNEIEEDLENEAKEIKSPHTKVQSKGKKTMEMNTHLLESHLQKGAGSTSDGSNSPVKIISHMEEYEEQNVDPLHLACTAETMLDTFPYKSDLNFSREFGIESDSFLTLQRYLMGENVESMKLELNFPIFLTVTPLLNNTVERAICVWISSFSNLIPPEMDRHLGFLEIPQPSDPKIEIYASGGKTRYARQFSGFANDWIYRKEVKKLLDAVIKKGEGEIMDFRSYSVDIEGGNRHTVSFIKKNVE